MKQINIFIEMAINVAGDCESMEIHSKKDNRQGKASGFIKNLKRRKFETAMVHKNKM